MNLQVHEICLRAMNEPEIRMALTHAPRSTMTLPLVRPKVSRRQF
jgi:hypothetical protein